MNAQQQIGEMRRDFSGEYNFIGKTELPAMHSFVAVYRVRNPGRETAYSIFRGKEMIGYMWPVGPDENGLEKFDLIMEIGDTPLQLVAYEVKPDRFALQLLPLEATTLQGAA